MSKKHIIVKTIKSESCHVLRIGLTVVLLCPFGSSMGSTLIPFGTESVSSNVASSAK